MGKGKLRARNESPRNLFIFMSNTIILCNAECIPISQAECEGER